MVAAVAAVVGESEPVVGSVRPSLGSVRRLVAVGLIGFAVVVSSVAVGVVVVAVAAELVVVGVRVAALFADTLGGSVVASRRVAARSVVVASSETARDAVGRPA